MNSLPISLITLLYSFFPASIMVMSDMEGSEGNEGHGGGSFAVILRSRAGVETWEVISYLPTVFRTARDYYCVYVSVEIGGRHSLNPCSWYHSS